MKKAFALVTSFFCLLLFAAPLFAGPALDAVKSNVDKVLEVVKDSSLKGEAGKKTKNARIRAISEAMFDFVELSRRTLSANWNKLSPSQQKEFIELYKSLLENAYIDKITSYTDEKIVYDREVALSEKTVEVQSMVVRKGGDIPIYYRLLTRGGGWKIYDVVIEGVSLVSNYRTQFREILANNKPEYLLDTMRKKVGKK